MDEVIKQRVNPERIRDLTRTLLRYKAGKASVDSRIVNSEQWWKLRNISQEDSRPDGMPATFRSRSGWLHNVITSKHADAMEAYPQPDILPREASDKPEARMLSSIIPVVLEQNGYEETYSECQYSKLKFGTSVQKVVWDPSKLGGLGDISVTRVNVLNLFWEPGIEDIQDSRYVFQVELVDKSLLREMYPQFATEFKTSTVTPKQYQYDDKTSTEDKCTVVDCYYRKPAGDKMTLQYIKFVGETVLYATEDDPQWAERGLYDHGKYPYVFDALFPVEGTPCGYGYVDLCKSPQEEIDLLKTLINRNAAVNASPRFFVRSDGSINEEEFADLNQSIIHSTGNLGEDSIRAIQSTGLGEVYVNHMLNTIQELRETSGNTETSTGSTSSGVTAATAIAALQEASGKGSRDATKTSYRAFSRVVELVIELIRQFYDAPRSFRITGEDGQEAFVQYINSGLQPQGFGTAFGQDMGYRLPVFDVKVEPQKETKYTQQAQNELALQFYNLGFFEPTRVDQASACLEMMDFDGKYDVKRKIEENGTMAQRLAMVEQYALTLAAKYGDQQAIQQLSSIVAATTGGVKEAPAQQSVSADGMGQNQSGAQTMVENARRRSQEASQPEGGQL